MCAGIGEYFSIDPTLVRIAFLALSVLTGGVFLLAYLFAYLVMPETPIWTDPQGSTPQNGSAYPASAQQPPVA